MTTGFTQAAEADAGLDDLLIEALGARKVTAVLPTQPLIHGGNGHGPNGHGPNGHGSNGHGSGGNGQTLTDASLAATIGVTVAVPAAAPAPAAPAAARAVDSTPDFAAAARQFARSAATAGPLLAADLLTVAVAGSFALLALKLFRVAAPATAGGAAPMVVALLVLGYWMNGLYSEVWVHSAMELRQLTFVTSVVLLSAAAAGVVVPGLAAWCLLSWAVLVPALPLARALARCCCAGRTWWGFPTLVIGTGRSGDATARALVRSRTTGLRPALLTDPEGACRSSVVPVVNEPAMLESWVRAKGIHHAVLCVTDLDALKLPSVLERYGRIASHVLVTSEPPPLPALWGAQRVFGMGGTELRNGLLLPTLRAAKRATDVALALAALTAGLPLLLAIAAMVKLSSPGRVLYGHKRIGRYGRKFTAWKFRTMYRGADALLRMHLERSLSARLEWERDQKLRDDPRVTRLGRFLRRASLDELPQMWNVLKGDMSVVGPRPIVDDEVARYGDSFALYTAVKPGITGLWQVSGRTDVGYEMRVKLDSFYVRNWSPWLDLYVIVRTVAALLCRRGAY